MESGKTGKTADFDPADSHKKLDGKEKTEGRLSLLSFSLSKTTTAFLSPPSLRSRARSSLSLSSRSARVCEKEIGRERANEKKERGSTLFLLIGILSLPPSDDSVRIAFSSLEEKELLFRSAPCILALLLLLAARVNRPA